jgi:hypothetical protein
MRYTIEQKAYGVAEYWLTGSQRRAAETLNLGSHHTIGEWVRAAEAPKTAPHKSSQNGRSRSASSRHRSASSISSRSTFSYADCRRANFRDRTGLIKIVGEQMLLQKRPTSIQQEPSAAQLDAEIAELLSQLAANDGSTGPNPLA